MVTAIPLSVFGGGAVFVVGPSTGVCKVGSEQPIVEIASKVEPIRMLRILIEGSE